MEEQLGTASVCLCLALQGPEWSGAGRAFQKLLIDTVFGTLPEVLRAREG